MLQQVLNEFRGEFLDLDSGQPIPQRYGCCVGGGWSDFPRRRVEGRLPHSHRVGEHYSREVDGKRD